MNDIHDIKPALDMGADWSWLPWILTALAAAAAGLLAWWWWRRRRKAEQEPSLVVPVSPEVEALAELDRLAADDGIKGKQFYFSLSAILRRYAERRYAIPAEEMTLEELLPGVAQLPVDQDLRERFKTLCRRCEPIKFADAPADKDLMPRDLTFVREFVRRTTATMREENPSNSRTR